MTTTTELIVLLDNVACAAKGMFHCKTYEGTQRDKALNRCIGELKSAIANLEKQTGANFDAEAYVTELLRNGEHHGRHDQVHRRGTD